MKTFLKIETQINSCGQLPPQSPRKPTKTQRFLLKINIFTKIKIPRGLSQYKNIPKPNFEP